MVVSDAVFVFPFAQMYLISMKKVFQMSLPILLQQMKTM